MTTPTKGPEWAREVVNRRLAFHRGEYPENLESNAVYFEAKHILEAYKCGLDDAAKVAETEEEPLEETMPDGVKFISPFMIALASIVACKKNIAKRIRALGEKS